jgi:hypothetical protein
MLITQGTNDKHKRKIKPKHTAIKPKSYLAVIDELFEAGFTCSRVRKMLHDAALHEFAIAHAQLQCDWLCSARERMS